VIWNLLKKLNVKQLIKLLAFFLRDPWYAIPTVSATIKCMRIANEKFGATHHGNNQANAFRHALWNILIIKQCSQWRKGASKATLWAKKITEWHEKFSPNEPLERDMDLHNNHVGRLLFSEIDTNTDEEIVIFITEKAKNAQRIRNPKDIEKFPETLIYISE